MPIIEPIIRPPAEAGSFLLQVTTGCSSNTCTFCAAYKGKPFSILEYETIAKDIEEGAQLFPETRRIFLLDGDALVVKNDKLLPVLRKIQKSFPRVTRISSYANGYNVTARSDKELKDLRDNKLSLIYLGLESGSQKVLDNCLKQSTRDEMVTAINRAQSVGIKASVIVLLGLGGRQNSRLHVDETIAAINKMQPRYLSFLTVMVIPGTPMYKEVREGRHEQLNSKELLQEAYDIVSGLELERTIFRSNHASNYLSLEGNFPKDKKKLLDQIRNAISGKFPLKPEFLRGL